MKLKRLFITKFLPVIAFLLFVNLTYGQKTISGTVTGDDGGAIPGVSILVKGTTTGTMTDAVGKYSLAVTDDATILVFSYIGMETQEVAISGNTINCVMGFSESEIAEIVVIGYGEVKKEDATGSVTAISSDDFNKGAITSPQDLLTGKIAGVQITSGGGAPGDNSTIRIRGGSSLSSSNDPLFVIDGIPIDNSSIAGMRNPLNTINPNDIETFTVLKDASATAIYGSRASNGVIIITTKKGRLGSPLKISYNGVYSYGVISNTIDVLSADEYRTIFQDRYSDNQNALDLLGDANTNWQDQVFQNSFGHDHSVSITGSTKVLPYRASLGYSSQEGIIKTDALDRTTMSVGLNPEFLDKHLKVNVNVKGMNIQNRFADKGAVGSAITFDPTQPIYSGNNDYGGYFTWLQGDDPIPIATRNPLAQLELREDLSTANRIMGNIQLDYTTHFLPDLKANLNLSIDRSSSEGTVDVPDYASWEINSNPNGGGIHREYAQIKQNALADFYLNYKKTFGQSKLDVMAGYSFQQIIRSYDWSVERNAVQVDTVSPENDNPKEYYLESFFGRIQYSLKDKYLATFTLRNDYSTRFFPGTKRSGLFPAVAFAWKINNENFMSGVNAVNNLKLRIGYGITGQQDFGDNYYPYLAAYLFSEINARYQFGDQFITTMRPGGYNADLVWEETTTYNIALDYGFVNNRINGSIEYYQRYTDNLINHLPVPAGTNFSNELYQNVGTLENTGVEFSVNAIPVLNKDLSWEVGFNIAYNENKITKLTATEDTSYIGVSTGGISGGVGNNIQIHSVDYPANSFYVYEQVYNADGTPIEGLYVDQDGDGQITDRDKYHADKPAPSFFAGFSSRLNYKNFDFSFAGRFSIGNYVYNNVKSGRAVIGTMYNSGYLTNVTTDATFSNFENNAYFSDYYLEDASFLRLDNLTLGYTFDKLFDTKLQTRVYATAQNVMVVTNYTGLDPEIFDGIDNNIYPRPKTFLLGLSIDF